MYVKFQVSTINRNGKLKIPLFRTAGIDLKWSLNFRKGMKSGFHRDQGMKLTFFQDHSVFVSF